MNGLSTHTVDTLLANELIEKVEETKELEVTEEIKSVGHAMNAYRHIYNSDKKNAKDSPQNETPPPP